MDAPGDGTGRGEEGKRGREEAGAKSATDSAEEPASVVGVTFGGLVNCPVG